MTSRGSVGMGKWTLDASIFEDVMKVEEPKSIFISGCLAWHATLRDVASNGP